MAEDIPAPPISEDTKVVQTKQKCPTCYKYFRNIDNHTCRKQSKPAPEKKTASGLLILHHPLFRPTQIFIGMLGDAWMRDQEKCEADYDRQCENGTQDAEPLSKHEKLEAKRLAKLDPSKYGELTACASHDEYVHTQNVIGARDIITQNKEFVYMTYVMLWRSIEKVSMGKLNGMTDNFQVHREKITELLIEILAENPMLCTLVSRISNKHSALIWYTISPFIMSNLGFVNTDDIQKKMQSVLEDLIKDPEIMAKMAPQKETSDI